MSASFPAQTASREEHRNRTNAHTRPGFLLFNRPPRLSEALEDSLVTLPAPPVPPAPSGSLVSTLGIPALTFFVMAVLVFTQIGNLGSSGYFLWITLAMSSVYLVGSLVVVVSDWWSNRKTFRKQTADFRALLETTEQTLARMASQERERRADLDPPVAELYNRVREPGNPSPRLWERRPTDRDFLRLRFGVSSVPSSTRVEVTPPSKPTDLYTQAQELASRFATLDLAPLTVDLPVVGSLGVAGPHEMAAGLVNSMLCQLVSHHSPVDVRLAAIYPREHAEGWEWLKWAAHSEPLRAAGISERAVGCTPQTAGRLLGMLAEELSARERRLAALRHDAPAPAPRIVVLLDGDRLIDDATLIELLLSKGPALNIFTIYIENSLTSLPSHCGAVIGVGDTPDYPCTYRVVGGGAGVSAEMDFTNPRTAEAIARSIAPLQVVSAGRTNGMPDRVRLLDLLGIDDPAEADLARFWERYGEQGEHGEHEQMRVPVGQMAGERILYLSLRSDSPEGGPHGIVGGMTGSGKSELLRSVVAAFAVTHHPHKLNFVLVDYKGGSAFAGLEQLPHTVGLVTNLDEHLAERALAALQAELKERQKRLRAARVDSVAEYQQMREQNPTRNLAPLPNLVIVVDEFAQLKEEVPSFIQGLIGIARIGRSLGVHLLLATQRPAGVVTDEIRANTSYRVCLRVADTQDSNEVLGSPEAALLPSSVPGRAFMKVGTESIVAFQAGRITTPYTGPTAGERTHPPLEDFAPSLDIANGAAGTGAEAAQAMTLRTHTETELDVLVKRIVSVAESLGIERLPSPWPPPLPSGVHLREVLPEGVYPEITSRQAHNWPALPTHGWAAAPVGLLDEPDRQRQEPFVLSMGHVGNVLAFGASRSGKTNLLRSIAVSLALTHRPDALNLYCIDCGRGGLAPLAELPHCGAVLGPADVERVMRLIVDLRAGMAERAHELQRVGAFSLDEYMQSPRRDAGRSYPFVIVLLDNFNSFRETFLGDNAVLHMDLADKLMADLRALVGEGQAAGIHFLITVDSWNVMIRYPALLNAIGLRLALRQSDDADYSYVGLRLREGLALPPGRGFAGGVNPLEFQVAIPAAPAVPRNVYAGDEGEDDGGESKRAASLAWLRARLTGQAAAGGGARQEAGQAEVPVEWVSGEEQTAALYELCRYLGASWNGKKADPVRQLPEVVRLDELLGMRNVPNAEFGVRSSELPNADAIPHSEFNIPNSEQMRVPIGLDDTSLAPHMVEIGSESGTFVVGGPPRSGKSTLLLDIALGLACRYPPERVRFAVAALRRSPLWGLDGLPHLMGRVVKSSDELSAMVRELRQELDDRQSGENRENGESGGTRHNSAIVVVIDDFEELLIGNSDALLDLPDLGRRGRTLGLSMVVSGLSQELSRSYDAAVEYLRRGQTGVLLCPNFKEDGELLNVRLPIMGHRPFPPGRGFSIRRGWTLVQCATPLMDEKDLTRSVTDWVRKIATS